MVYANFKILSKNYFISFVTGFKITSVDFLAAGVDYYTPATNELVMYVTTTGAEIKLGTLADPELWQEATTERVVPYNKINANPTALNRRIYITVNSATTVKIVSVLI